MPPSALRSMSFMRGKGQSVARHHHVKRRDADKDPPSVIVKAMEATVGPGVAGADVVTVVGKLFARRQPRGFTHNFVAFDHEMLPVAMLDDPLAAQQRHRAVG